MREQSFGEVIRIKQGHKSEALMNGISALARVTKLKSLDLRLLWVTESLWKSQPRLEGACILNYGVG